MPAIARAGPSRLAPVPPAAQFAIYRGHVQYRLPGAMLVGLAASWPNTASMVPSRAEPSRVVDPALPALAIPVGDLSGILLGHVISLL